MEKGSEGAYIITSTCPVCGRTFVQAPFHIYYDHRMGAKRRKVCSYNCETQTIKQKDDKPNSKPKKKYKCADGFVGTKTEVAKHYDRSCTWVDTKIRKGEIIPIGKEEQNGTDT